MMIFYFTGTGNSLFAARKIAAQTGAAIISIPQVINEQREYADDCIGFIYPQYAVGLPKMVRKFVLGNTFKADYFFAVDLYAFIRLGALGELAGIVPLNYGAYLKTPNNFIFAFNSSKNPQSILAKAEKRLTAIGKDIAERKNKPIKSRLKEGNATRHFGECKFKVSEKCVKCGTCAKVCPANNITVNEAVAFGNNCENCFACANLCPGHAVYSKQVMLKRRQYRNPHITAKEISGANNRQPK